LIADRQLADAPAGGGEDGIAKRRCDRRNTRLTHAANGTDQSDVGDSCTLISGGASLMRVTRY
jgi:hypothetical protein